MALEEFRAPFCLATNQESPTKLQKYGKDALCSSWGVCFWGDVLSIAASETEGGNRTFQIVKSVGLFCLAGLAEIGGEYMVWAWLREGKSVLVGVLGAVVLVIYGIIPTLQTTNNFGRIYAAYGGVFIVMSLLWDGKLTGPNQTCMT